MSDLTSQYIIAQEEHDYNKKYEEGTIIKHTIDDVTTTYIAKKNVPRFISVLDERYWKKIASTDEGGITDYNNLNNKPTINGVELKGNVTTNSLGIDNKFKGWFDSSTDLNTQHPSPYVGDFAYVHDASPATTVSIYRCATAGIWADSGDDVDTSLVQTFATGEEVNNVGIDDEPTAGSDNLVKSGGVENTTVSINQDSDAFYFTDSDGYIIAKIDSNGIHSAQSKHSVACMVLSDNYYPIVTPTRDESGNVTHAEVMFATGVEGEIDITYTNELSSSIEVTYGSYLYTITINRDVNGNVTTVSVN